MGTGRPYGTMAKAKELFISRYAWPLAYLAVLLTVRVLLLRVRPPPGAFNTCQRCVSPPAHICAQPPAARHCVHCRGSLGRRPDGQRRARCPCRRGTCRSSPCSCLLRCGARLPRTICVRVERVQEPQRRHKLPHRGGRGAQAGESYAAGPILYDGHSSTYYSNTCRPDQARSESRVCCRDWRGTEVLWPFDQRWECRGGVLCRCTSSPSHLHQPLQARLLQPALMLL